MAASPGGNVPRRRGSFRASLSKESPSSSMEWSCCWTTGSSLILLVIVEGVMKTIGFEHGMVEFIVALNKDSVRYFKIQGRYGDPVGQCNGLGQGDPFSVLVALLYVGVQMGAAEAPSGGDYGCHR